MNNINLNVKFQSPIAGTCDMVGFGSCVVPAQVDPELLEGQSLYASQAVAIKQGSTYLLPQVTAYTDESELPWGFLVTDGVNVRFRGSEECNVAQGGAIVHFKAGEAIAAGEAVSFDVASGKMMKPANASAAQFATANISNNVANFASVADGEFAITVGTTPTSFTGMDFSGASTLEEIAAVIQSKLGTAYLVSVNAMNNGLVITSATAGTDGNFTIEAVASGTGTDLTAANFLNVSAGESFEGAASSLIHGYAWTSAAGDGALFRVKIAAK